MSVSLPYDNPRCKHYSGSLVESKWSNDRHGGQAADMVRKVRGGVIS